MLPRSRARYAGVPGAGAGSAWAVVRVVALRAVRAVSAVSAEMVRGTRTRRMTRPTRLPLPGYGERVRHQGVRVPVAQTVLLLEPADQLGVPGQGAGVDQ